MRKLLFGETWTIPIGVLLTLVVAAAVRGDAVGFVVLAGVIGTLCAALRRVP